MFRAHAAHMFLFSMDALGMQLPACMNSGRPWGVYLWSTQVPHLFSGTIHEHFRTQLDLMERLALVQDAGVLQRLKKIFDKELGGDDDFTEEELTELREIDRRRKAGLDTYLPMEEALCMIREGRRA